MSPYHSQASDTTGDNMEVPQAVIAQAEAAASSNQPPDGQRPSQSASDQTPEALGSKEKHPRSSTNAQKGSQAPRIDGAQASNLQPSANVEQPVEQIPQVAYGTQLGQVDFSQDGFDTKAKVADDGRLNININQKTRGLSDLLVPALRSQLNLQQVDQPADHPPGYIPAALSGTPGQAPPPPLNVVVHVVGSRGDVQPFVALGKVLKETYGHRVRLATHGTFRQFVEENGLEFFSIGGDPAELMAFMVKNPGLMPGMDSLRSGDVGKRRKGMYEIVQGCWRSCIEVGDGTGIRASDDHLDSRSSLDSGIGMDGDPAAKPFVADAIIANPPSFAHVHCAEKLGIPLHLMFTMPWSPTQAFPHPLANIQSSNADTSITNFMTFREKSLNLEPVSLMWAPGMASRLRIPYTYCWSPALIPKPKDWGSHISISGFYFLSLASSFTPEPGLAAFLAAGPPPVYIGFGSIVVDDPNAMTKLIFEAVKQTGQRALVSKGWGGFGADALGIPEGIFMLGNVPHDWLFKHVSCVVHHGGAGTTAAGIALGKPTVIVPFFGDQPFWGAMVARAGAGPLPVPSKQLTAEKLAAAILEALKTTTLRRAQELGARIGSEKGTDVGAQSFHEKLDVDSMRCLVSPSRAAVWRVKRTTIRLSAFAATTLFNENVLDFNNLKLYRPREYDSEDGPWDPISGGASALLGTLGSLMMGFADFPVEILRALRIKPSENNVDSEVAVPSAGEKIKSANSSKVSLDSAPTGLGNREDSIDPASPLKFGDSHEGSLSPTETDRQSQKQPGARSHGPNSMKSALKGSLSRSSSRNSSPNRQAPHHHRSLSGSQAGQISLDAAVGAGKSIKQIVGAGLKSPMDFTLSLARGFHNAPKLYGDDSVRQADKVTGLQSGLKAAGKEFGFGFYDGISGLVTQPLEGAKREGVAGLIKGFGKGIGGVVLKPGAAIWGLPGYTFKGIYKELQKHFGSSVQNYIVAARTAQGYDEWHNSSQEERLDVVSRWQAIQVEIEKEKQLARHGSFHGRHCYLKTTIEERKKLSAEKKKEKKKGKKNAKGNDTEDVFAEIHASHPFLGPAQKSQESDPSHDDADFEEAIRTSVAATSRGNPEEDQMIERAIRASVTELHLASKEGDNNEAIQRAIKASVAEAASARNGDRSKPRPIALDGASDHEKELSAALQRSVQGNERSEERYPLVNVDFDDSGVDTDDDENFKAAIERSKSEPTGQPRAGKDEDDLQTAIELSRKAHEEHGQGLSKSMTEEEVVLEYVKKQSLAEEQLKKSIAANRDQ
ncbi:MAG: hypothetical protein ASARMPRED_005155 [Alectoria sarmentosa]|nr:MAG: hypothetical protein ASARMPRED_005155 [Alectoria sarmentosa]